MNLIPYLGIINNLNPLEQRLYFNDKHWCDFDYGNVDVSDHMAFISANYQNGISRQDIIDYFNQENHSLLRGFILAMIWGHGSSKGERADNRGPWKVSQMLNNIGDVNQILENAKQHLIQNDLQAAHTSFEKMKRCRVNFFSKYLYFLGRALGMEHYPLIFDARVAKTIAQLTTTNPNFFSILDIQPKQDKIAYNSYLMEIHSIANQLQIEAEKIEYFLFREAENKILT